MVKLGLCEGRHEIEGIDGYIFPTYFFSCGADMFDYGRMYRRIKEVFGAYDIKSTENVEVAIYVTGFTPALVEVLAYCFKEQIGVGLLHFNRDTSGYELQIPCCNFWRAELKDGGYLREE